MFAVTEWTWTPVGNIWRILYLSEDMEALKAFVPNDDPNIKVVETNSWFKVTGDKMVTRHGENINGIRVLTYSDALHIGDEFGRGKPKNIRIQENNEYGNRKEYVFGWVIMCHDPIEHDDLKLSGLYTDYNKAYERLHSEKEHDPSYSYWIEPATSQR